MTLGLLLKLVRCKGLVDSAQTTQLIRDGGKDVFEPHAYLVKIRYQVLQQLLSAWDKPWLPSLPASVNRLMFKNLLTILKAENETAPAPKKTSATPACRARLERSSRPFRRAQHAKSIRVRQRASSGFILRSQAAQRGARTYDGGYGLPEGAARHALSRCQNNLNAATEYLLAHDDDLVVHYRDNPNQPWGDERTDAADGSKGLEQLLSHLLRRRPMLRLSMPRPPKPQLQTAMQTAERDRLTQRRVRCQMQQWRMPATAARVLLTQATSLQRLTKPWTLTR